MHRILPNYYIYIYILYHVILLSEETKFVKLAILVEADLNAPFSIAIGPRCKGGCDSIPWIALLYP